MKDTNIFNLKILLITLLFTIFVGVSPKALVNIRIFNYKNNFDITHEGKKCEVFHWANDYCDPMFEVCVYTKNWCDILKKKIDHWKNEQRLYNVMNQNVELQNVERKFTVRVRIDDHDNLDVHDFIGVFTADFYLENFNQVYRQPMKLEGKKRSISLDASLMIKCATGYYGSKCEMNIYDCHKNCAEGNCVFHKEKEIFVCQCKQGWSGGNCKEFKTDNCKSLNCKLKCNQKNNINHCVCVDKIFQMSCQEPIQNYFPISKKTTFNITNSSKVSTKNFIKYSTNVSTKISTEINRNFRKTEITNSFNQTPKSPESFQHSERMKGSNSHSSQINSNEVFQSPSTIIIISLLLLLCICIISLLIVIRNMQKKSKTKLTQSSSSNRPLPQILFERHILPRETFKSHHPNNPYAIKSNFLYETCTIPSTRRSNNYVRENTDPYEEPIINNMESLTCETDVNDGDESDAYEMPINTNKSTNF